MKNTLSFLIFIFLFFLSSIVLLASNLSQQQESNEITIVAVGDITIGSNFTPLIEKQGAGIFFERIESIIQSADIAMASLNTSISDRGEPNPNRDPRFRAAPGLARALANAGFDTVSLATPYVMDFGIEALEDTISNLEWYNVKPVGAGNTPALANAPTWLKVESKKIALLGYLRGNEFNIASVDPIASAAYSQMIHAVQHIEDSADLVVVWLHWGKQNSEEKARQASIDRQRIFAHALIDNGADLVLCQQLHSLGGIEIYNEKPIVYSLADFIYDDYELQHARTIIPKVTFVKGSLKSIELIPILVNKLGDSVPQPRLLKVKDPEKNTIDTKIEETAIETLKAYQTRCATLKTDVVIEGERGWINLTP